MSYWEMFLFMEPSLPYFNIKFHLLSSLTQLSEFGHEVTLCHKEAATVSQIDKKYVWSGCRIGERSLFMESSLPYIKNKIVFTNSLWVD